MNEAELLIKNIHLFEAAIYDKPPYGSQGHESLQLSKPLNRCVHILQEKHRGISQQYQDRLDQVNSEQHHVLWARKRSITDTVLGLVSALSSYASHLEAGFLRVELPPAGLCAATPTEFSLSPSYLTRLDAEFGRVHQEYNRRLTTVQSLAQEIITLWAELGTPQAQTDPNLIKHHRDSPEQLGLRSDDLSQLEHKLAVLHIEKQDREAQLSDVKRRVETLWELLQLDDEDIRAFKSANRGFGLRVINEYEAELDRLHERKRQHLGLFIEDARCKIQQLWDDLFFSEEEMIEFTPAFQGRLSSDAGSREHTDGSQTYPRMHC